ncbi:uncharacterized protein LOC113398113 [Vanessa tameamea]|uniref:Uncharacterized protein LOC113398113 n=1 Tax=Vanessa tameamea TaxID=334116 RepID=A0A8B8I8I9_VANTA|nr:uncharacterized protein LOC113398113 [Vanessa tameamea]
MYRKIIITFALLEVAFASFLDGDFKLLDGVKLVAVRDSNSIEDGRSFGNKPLYRIAKFLQNHELHVKLPNLIEKDKIGQIFSESMKIIDDSNKENNATGRGKGDGGASSLALLGLMFAKTIGAAGIGGLGLLTMKALAVSALALMLSAIVGIKKLTSHDDHDDHQVIYAGHHGHHRRRRDINTPLPYQGWTEYQN